MEHPMPLDTRQKLLRLSSIYTQGADSGCDPPMEHSGQPSGIYTLESLHERLRVQSRRQVNMMHPGTVSDSRKALPERTEDFQEHLSPDVLAERAAELRGSPWKLCKGQFSCHANLQNMNVIGYSDSMLFHYI